MLLDAREVPNGAVLESDLCVIGAGAAGLSVAHELAGGPYDVCVLEAGGLRFERAAQRSMSGEHDGDPYFPLEETRLARFGGSTGVWAGWCRPLDPIDFEARDWVPHSGWPFGPEVLNPFYVRAHAILGLGPYDYDAAAWSEPDAPPLPLAGNDVRTSLFHVSPVRFGEQYRAEMERARNVRVVLHAHALELLMSTSGRAVARVRAGTLEGKRIEVAARLFALAAGGVENARLLLLSAGERGVAPGNEHDAVGRFFCEHVYADSGEFVPVDPRFPLGLYYPRFVARPGGGGRVRAVLSLTESALRRWRILGCGLFLHAPYESHPVFTRPGVRALLELWDAARRRNVPVGLRARLGPALRDPGGAVVALACRLLGRSGRAPRLRLRTLAEQAPDPRNRVTLGEARDAFGRRVARVEWRRGALELASVRRAHDLVDEALRGAQVGRIEKVLAGEHWPPGATGGKHHMGTTRMHRDPRRGVVDADGRVHGTDNLYAAGSSVFPTPGFVNPTLTIVALALRLADHLKARLAPAAD